MLKMISGVAGLCVIGVAHGKTLIEEESIIHSKFRHQMEKVTIDDYMRENKAVEDGKILDLREIGVLEALENENGGLKLQTGSTLTLLLKENPSTGYQW